MQTSHSRPVAACCRPSQLERDSGFTPSPYRPCKRREGEEGDQTGLWPYEKGLNDVGSQRKSLSRTLKTLYWMYVVYSVLYTLDIASPACCSTSRLVAARRGLSRLLVACCRASRLVVTPWRSVAACHNSWRLVATSWRPVVASRNSDGPSQLVATLAGLSRLLRLITVSRGFSRLLAIPCLVACHLVLVFLLPVFIIKKIAVARGREKEKWLLFFWEQNGTNRCCKFFVPI